MPFRFKVSKRILKIRRLEEQLRQHKSAVLFVKKQRDDVVLSNLRLRDQIRQMQQFKQNERDEMSRVYSDIQDLVDNALYIQRELAFFGAEIVD